MTSSNIDPVTGRALDGDERETIDLDTSLNGDQEFGNRDSLGDSYNSDAPRYAAGEGFEPVGGSTGALEDSYGTGGTQYSSGSAGSQYSAGTGSQYSAGTGGSPYATGGSDYSTGADGGAKEKAKQVAGQVGDQAGAVKDTVGEQASAVKDTVTDKAAQVKDVAVQRAGDVAGVTKDELNKLVSDARGQVQTLWDQAAGQLREQAGTGQQHLAELVHGLASELGELASKAESDGPVTSLLKQAAHQSGQFSHWLSEAHTDDVLSELRRFARRRPAVFLAGATLAGIAVGRLGRGLMAAAKTEQQTAALAQEPGYYSAGTLGGQSTGYGATTYGSAASGTITPPATFYGDGADLDTDQASSIDTGYQGEFGDDTAIRPDFTGGERR